MRFSMLSSTILIAASVAACADSTGPGGTRPVTVSFTTSGASAASASLAPLALLGSTSAADALVITKAQLVLSRIELQKAGASCTSTEAAGDNDGDREDECAELELAPTVVDLPVNGTVVSKLQVAVPAGTYSALEAKISPVHLNNEHNGKGSAAFLAAHPDLAGVSIRVEGTFNGKAFTFTSPVKAEIETKFNPPLDITTTTPNITVNADLSNWFKTSSGTLIDPATANAGGPNAELVAQNIRRSFKAFRDDDHDGRDDHGESGR